jgi:hypothetical protein
MTLNLSSATASDKVVAILKQHGVGNWRARGGTDKEQLASGEEGSGHHSYGAIYEELSRRLNAAKKPVNAVEIGVQYGGSLLLWQGLFPKGAIVGIDTEEKMHDYVKQELNWSRAEVWRKDAYAHETIEALKEKFPDGIHFMVDDGPHTLNTQASFLRNYTPMLAEGGYAVIEDIQGDSQVRELSANVPEGFEWEVIDRRSINGRYDDLMLVVHSPARHDNKTETSEAAQSFARIQGGNADKQRQARKKPSASNRNRTQRGGDSSKEQE